MTFKNKILPKKPIPYWEARSFKKQLEESSSRRELSKIGFGIRKLKIFILTWLAYFCPIAKLRVILNKWKGVNIGERVFIGPACILELSYPEYIYIEDDAGLAGGVQIITHTNPNKHFSHIFESSVSPVVIKKGAWLTIRTTILPGITIGSYSVISCGSVVTRDIPDYTIAVGNPARVVSKLPKVE